VLNPGTSQDDIEYLVDDVDMVLLMTVNPVSAARSSSRDASQDPDGSRDARRPRP
jgi:pentose-5-phosphate-3-epimerase